MLSSWMSSGKHEEFKDLAWILLDEARILEGALPEDPAKFSDRLNRLVSRTVEGESSSNQPE
jgi:molecular chaperone HtpG